MRGYDFSKLTPEWQAFIESPAIERIIAQMAHKYLRDAGLREDAKQEARIGLATVDPAAISGDPTKYAANVIRNSILSMATSYNTGDWYSGRTMPFKDRATGTMRKVRYPTRYASLDMLTNEYGLEIAEDRSISWEGMDDDGLQELAPLADDSAANATPLSDSAQHHSAEVSFPRDTEDALVSALDYEASLAKLSDVDRETVEKIIAGHMYEEALGRTGSYYTMLWRLRCAVDLGYSVEDFMLRNRGIPREITTAVRASAQTKTFEDVAREYGLSRMDVGFMRFGLPKVSKPPRATVRADHSQKSLRHGTHYAYMDKRCRCEECVAFGDAYNATRRVKDRLRSRAARALKQLHARRRTTAERLSRRANDALAHLHAA